MPNTRSKMIDDFEQSFLKDVEKYNDFRTEKLYRVIISSQLILIFPLSLNWSMKLFNFFDIKIPTFRGITSLLLVTFFIYFFILMVFIIIDLYIIEKIAKCYNKNEKKYLKYLRYSYQDYQYPSQLYLLRGIKEYAIIGKVVDFKLNKEESYIAEVLITDGGIKTYTEFISVVKALA